MAGVISLSQVPYLSLVGVCALSPGTYLSLVGVCSVSPKHPVSLWVGCVLGRGVISPQTRYLIEGLILALQARGTYISLVGVSWPPWYTLKEGCVLCCSLGRGVFSLGAVVPYLSLWGTYLSLWGASWVRLILGVRLIPG